ncbi:MAG: SDR family oxidoreductase [Bacteroidota bacterium]
MIELEDKVIWITGASSGIGEALAYELTKKGCKLILSARRIEELERVKSSCPESAQSGIAILPLDLAAADSLQLTTEAAIQLFGRIDILVNNGGISQRSLVKDTDLGVHRKLMEVNYFGTIAITRHLIAHFMERKQGMFAVVSSLVGKFGTPYRSGYAASKHALHGFFDSLQAELYEHNIRVCMICPGFVKTDVSKNALTEKGEKFHKMDQAQANGMAADQCARKIIKAIQSKRYETYIGGKEKMGVYLKRYAPKLFNKVVRKMRVR